MSANHIHTNSILHNISCFCYLSLSPQLQTRIQYILCENFCSNDTILSYDLKVELLYYSAKTKICLITCCEWGTFYLQLYKILYKIIIQLYLTDLVLLILIISFYSVGDLCYCSFSFTCIWYFVLHTTHNNSCNVVDAAFKNIC